MTQVVEKSKLSTDCIIQISTFRKRKQLESIESSQFIGLSNMFSDHSNILVFDAQQCETQSDRPKYLLTSGPGGGWVHKVTTRLTSSDASDPIKNG